MRIKLGLAVLTIGLLIAAGCGGGAADTTGDTAAEEASAATVSFIAPEDGSKQSDEVTAEVAIEGFKINADAVGQDAVEGEGHLHFSMDEGKYDNAKYSGANGELAEELGVDGQYSPSTEPTITYTGLPKGEHTLEVYLANNDHTETGAEASTTFEVK
jgi:hypothetical protein